MNRFEFNSVGQGLLYVGSLMDGTYNFVFDCGTESKQQYVEKCIDDFAGSLSNYKSKPIIEFVVISHLHRDHFSGLRYLLQKVRVNKIYLPYLGDNKIIIRSTLALSIFQVNDIEEDTQNMISLFSFMCGLYGVDESGDFNRYRELVVFINNVEAMHKKDSLVYITDTFDVGYKDSPYWRFSLIQSCVSGSTLKLLSDSLDDYFNKLGENDLIKIILNYTNSLEDLKKIYEIYFGKRNALNLTSIILVHFPLYENAISICPRNSEQRHFEKFNKFNCYFPYCCVEYNAYLYDGMIDSRVVSILSGDAMVDAIIAGEINHVKGDHENLVLQVPHHGSEDNWAAILKNKIEAKIYIISFGYGNTYRHPNSFTINSLIKDSKEFYCANQKDKYLYFID